MKNREIIHIIISILLLTVIISFINLINKAPEVLGFALLFASLIILVNVFTKKWIASSLDADVEHELWTMSRFGFKPGQHVGNKIPTGVIIPAILTVFSLGAIKCMTFLTYETTALKRRAARRFGHYSFTEMTDWHNALIGGAGIIGVLLLGFISYWIPGLEGLPTLSVYYAFWNMIPFSKLDGSQIFFGSRVLYTTLALITLAALVMAMLIV